MALKSNPKSQLRLGNYDVQEKIADGGMGSVYKALDRATGQIVAIKLVTPEVAANPVLVERFKQEYRTASGLIHPNIVRGLDFGFEGANLFMVMEYVDGPSLGQRIDREKRLPEAEAVRIIVQVADALDLAHRHKIIHRDVKPDNILVTSTGQAKLTDLGLAKNRQVDLDLTRPLTGLGTPYFMAPEQFGDAKHADVRYDVYSLGATLYMALTGELPFFGKTNLAILKLKMQDSIVPPAKLVPGLSTRVDAAICKAIRANANQRFASCKEFITALIGKQQQAEKPREVPRERPSTTADKNSSRRRERRASVRYSASLEASCQPTSRLKERCWSARIQDISSSGVCLILRRRFEPGTVLTAELQGKTDTITKTLLVHVMRVHEQSPRKWSVGCAFDRELNDFELKALL
jgi:serine/threonine protein kinase